MSLIDDILMAEPATDIRRWRRARDAAVLSGKPRTVISTACAIRSFESVMTEEIA